MLSQTVRSSTEDFVSKVAGFFAALGFTPNMLTLLGATLTSLIGVLVVYGHFFTAGVLLIFFAAFDALDGALARYTNSVTKFGGFLDSVTDRYAEMAILLGVLHYLLDAGYPPMKTCYLVFFALCGSVLVPYTRARAEGLNFECKGGFFSRFERLVVLVATFILAGIFNDNILVAGMLIIAIFTNITAIQRIFHVYQLDTALMEEEQQQKSRK